MVPISHEKITLSNGLDVILHEDHSLPIVAVNIWYHVGSKDEEEGRTGFAHLFEHFMFEGSKHHNRSYFEPLQEVGALVNGSTAMQYETGIPKALVFVIEGTTLALVLIAAIVSRYRFRKAG